MAGGWWDAPRCPDTSDAVLSLSVEAITDLRCVSIAPRVSTQAPTIARWITLQRMLEDMPRSEERSMLAGELAAMRYGREERRR